MVRIILNADDFGKSKERNRAINEAFKKNMISSAALIVTGKYLPEAIDYINQGGYVEKIHLHVNLSANQLQEGSEDAPLTETMKNDSFFCKNGKFINYKSLPHNFSDIRKWKIVYREIVAQYDLFKEITNGKGDYKHIDFHLWYNLTWPVAIALNVFTWKYKISSVRYHGLHHTSLRFTTYRMISWNPHVKYIPSTNIDFYVSNNKKFGKYQTVELYCHPNYKDGIFLDDSPSYIGHERLPMLKQIKMLRDCGDFELVSWKDIL